MIRIRQWPAAMLLFFALIFSIPGFSAELPDFTVLVERQGPAVVNISTTQSESTKTSTFPGLDESDPMFDLFRRFIPKAPVEPRPHGDNRSLGSGFIISDDGFILTNAHVIEDAEEIFVRLADKREYRAKVIGTDRRSDIAVIRIDATGLPVVVMGQPDALKVGEWVVAIGSPFGFEHSVTAGIVSAKGRSLPDENFVPFIQTDVAINPGNSGGPLFNLKGEVVGVNSQIYSQTGGFMGLSFAIPIDVAMDMQDQLRTAGIVRRGRIGVAIQEVTRGLAESFGLPGAAGALVSAVESGGPAEQAGIQQGDVISHFDGKSVSSSSDLPRLVAATRPGSTLAVLAYRDGAERSFQVTVGEWSDDSEPESRSSREAAPMVNKLGLVVAPLTEADKREIKASEGVVVERVSDGANRADLEPGDVVTAIVRAGRQTALASVQDFERVVAELKDGEQVSLLVLRGGGKSYVSLRAGS